VLVLGPCRRPFFWSPEALFSGAWPSIRRRACRRRSSRALGSAISIPCFARLPRDNTSANRQFAAETGQVHQVRCSGRRLRSCRCATRRRKAAAFEFGPGLVVHGVLLDVLYGLRPRRSQRRRRWPGPAADPKIRACSGVPIRSLADPPENNAGRARGRAWAPQRVFVGIRARPNRVRCRRPPARRPGVVSANKGSGRRGFLVPQHADMPRPLEALHLRREAMHHQQADLATTPPSSGSSCRSTSW